MYLSSSGMQATKRQPACTSRKIISYKPLHSLGIIFVITDQLFATGFLYQDFFFSVWISNILKNILTGFKAATWTAVMNPYYDIQQYLWVSGYFVLIHDSYQSSAVMCANHSFQLKNKYLSRHELLWTTKASECEPSVEPCRLENHKRNERKPQI